MAVLQNGKFVFLDDKRMVHMETEAKGKFSLLYGGPASAFSASPFLSVVAIVYPADPTPGRGSLICDGAQSIVRVYRYIDGQLLELLDELEIPFASDVMWASEHFLVSSSPLQPTSILEFTRAQKLKLFVQDTGVFPFVCLHLLGLVKQESRCVELWDLAKNKKTDTWVLPPQEADKCKHSVTGTCSSGNYVFVMDINGTVHSAYITKGSVRRLSTPSLSFGTQMQISTASELNLPTHKAVLCAAVSTAQVILAVPRCGGIVKLKYEKKYAQLIPIAEMIIPSLESLMAVSKDRYLAVFRETQHKRQKYVCCDILLEPIAERSSAKPVYSTPAEGGDISTIASAMEERKRGLEQEKDNAHCKAKTVSTTKGDLNTNGGGNTKRKELLAAVLGCTLLLACVLYTQRGRRK